MCVCAHECVVYMSLCKPDFQSSHQQIKADRLTPRRFYVSTQGLCTGQRTEMFYMCVGFRTAEENS